MKSYPEFLIALLSLYRTLLSGLTSSGYITTPLGFLSTGFGGGSIVILPNVVESSSPPIPPGRSPNYEVIN